MCSKRWSKTRVPRPTIDWQQSSSISPEGPPSNSRERMERRLQGRRGFFRKEGVYTDANSFFQAVGFDETFRRGNGSIRDQRFSLFAPALAL